MPIAMFDLCGRPLPSMCRGGADLYYLPRRHEPRFMVVMGVTFV
jgi:hypothetical protein